MGLDIIPKSDAARLTWAENMERSFPSVGAGLGFSPAEIDEVLADCRMLRFVITNALGAKAHSKAAIAYKKMILGKRKPTAQLSLPPEFTPLELPEVITMSGLINRLQKAAARMKLGANYSKAVGELLRIIPAKASQFVPDEGKPEAKIAALINSVVRIDWTKGKFHGVYVESQRGDETDWERLGVDTLTPYIDARPPLEAGKPETRRYRLRYVFNDEGVGSWSNVFVIITIP